MRMFTILIFGAARLCVRTASGQRSGSCVRLVSATRSDYITKKRVFSVGGIIGCFPFRKIAGYVSTRFWRANHSRKSVLLRESLAKSGEVRTLPLTHRVGRHLPR